jgi:hypothetical protein
MSQTVRIIPTGGYDHVGINYLSSYTAAQRIIVRTAASGGTDYAAFNPSTLAIETDKVNEFTAAAGVTIDSVLLKDGGATLTAGLTATTIGGTVITASTSVSTPFVAGNNIYVNSTGSTLDLRIGGTNVLSLVAAAVTPGSDNSLALGSGSYRWQTVVTSKVESGGTTLAINAPTANSIDFTVNNVMVWRITSGGLLTPATRPDYTLNTWSLARTLPNTGSATTTQIADTLATLIADLVALGLLQ